MVRATAPQTNITEKIQQNQEFLNIKTAAILPSNSGYGNYSYIIQTVEDLIKTFDYPTSYNFKYWFQVWNYLQYNNDGIWVTRPVKTTDYNYSIQLYGTTVVDDDKTNSNLYEPDLASNLIFNTTGTQPIEVYNRFVENDSRTAVIVCSSEAYWQNAISNEEISIIRDIGVYDYNDLSSVLNNIYQIQFDEHTITEEQLFDNLTNTATYLVVPGNLTHMQLGEYIRLEGASTQIKQITADSIHQNGIEYNGYREEGIVVAYEFEYTSGSNSGVEPSIGDKIRGVSGAYGYIHSFTVDSGTSWAAGDATGYMVIHSMTDVFASENYGIADSTLDDVTLVALDYSLNPDAIIVLTGNHQYLTTSDTVQFYGNDTNYAVSSVTYDGTNHKTEIITDITTSLWDSVNIYDTLIIESDTTLIIVDSQITVAPTFTLKYLAQDWNDVDQGLGGTYGSVLEHAENDEIWQYNYTTNVWEKNSTILVADYYYYIKDLDTVYKYTGGVLVLDTLQAFEYTPTIAIKDLYDSTLIKSNYPLTFEDVFDREPDWNEGEFAIGILRKNIDSGKFELVETFIVDGSQKSEIEMYNQSQYVYSKLNNFYQFDFENGAAVAIQAEQTVIGGTSSSTAVVYSINKTSGLWDSGSAAGTIILKSLSGDFIDGEIITVTPGGVNFSFCNISNESQILTDTYNNTVENLTITVDESKNFDDVSYFTNTELYDVSKVYLDKDSYNIDYLIGYKSIIDGSFYSLDNMTKISAERSNCITLNSIWEETDFFGLTSEQILAKLVLYYGFKNSQQMIKYWSKFSAFFANMKLQYDPYNEEYRWVPLNGDVAGLFVENATTSSGVGYGNNLKNVVRLLFNLSTYNHRKEMNLNGLNVVQYDNLKNPIIFDSITLTKDLEDVFRELHLRKNMNMIENDLRNMYFSKLIKLISENDTSIRTMTNNYLASLKPVILNAYKSKIEIVGSVVYIYLTLTFTEILRTVEVEITIDDNNINIIEK